MQLTKAIFPILLLATLIFQSDCQSGDGTYFVSPDSELVEWEGWGTSMAWWPDVLGAMPQDVIEEVTRAFFSKDELNFNIVRYTIGGTTPGKYMCGPYRDGGATESFLDGPDSSYDWTRDPRQRAILFAAKALGVDTFEAFSNSPPQWMTISGCSKGNDGGGALHENFDPVNATAFADYATEVIRHFHEDWNVTFQSYAPFNEPSGLYGNGYWHGSKQSQEGCSMSLTVMAEVVKAMAAALEQKKMDYVRLTIADETQVNQAITSQEYFHQQGINHLAEKVNVHGYSDDGNLQRDVIYMRAHRDGHRLWMDEIGWSENPENGVAQGMTVARRIITDVRKMLPSAWVYWQAMEDAGAWGLLSVPYRNATKENIRYNSGFYAMKQFSKFIKKGSVFIQINNENAVASYNEEDKSLVIVILNDSVDSPEEEYQLALFTSMSTVSVTMTLFDDHLTENNAAIPPPTLDIPGNSFTYVAPARSLTTLVFSNISRNSAVENEFHNGNFESQNEFWTVQESNERDSKNGGSSLNYPFRGNFSGFVEPSLADTEISQSFVVPGKVNETTQYYLTAWCKTGGAVTVLGARVNDNVRKEIEVSSSGGYQSFGLSFEATTQDVVTIYFSATKNSSGASYIDEVTLVKVLG